MIFSGLVSPKTLLYNWCRMHVQQIASYLYLNMSTRIYAFCRPKEITMNTTLQLVSDDVPTVYLENTTKLIIIIICWRNSSIYYHSQCNWLHATIGTYMYCRVDADKTYLTSEQHISYSQYCMYAITNWYGRQCFLNMNFF